jgi:hypothetical protein
MAFDPRLSKFFQNIGRFQQKISRLAQCNGLGVFDNCLFVVCNDAGERVFGMDTVEKNRISNFEIRIVEFKSF